MTTFSQRMGIKPIRSLIQKESADVALRNALWNGLTLYYLNRFTDFLSNSENSIQGLAKRIWVNHYKDRLDEIPYYLPNLVIKIKNDFHESSWNEMFDILEFIPNNYIIEEHFGGLNNKINNQFYIFCNSILEQNLSAYRFVDKFIVEISSEEEITAIEESMQITSTFGPVKVHLRRALELLSDRSNPDYRNSIKESISAIESISCIITGNQKATLGQALKEMEKRIEIHAALKSSFSSLYGYTSDANGIRHSLLEESTLKQEDAKFMLVSCSAFVNYLIVKNS